MTMQSLSRRLGLAVVMAVIVWFLSIKLDTFRDYQIAEVAIEVTAVAGLSVLTGLSGQISLGNGAFMAVGGYTTALTQACHLVSGKLAPRKPGAVNTTFRPWSAPKIPW